MTCFIINLVEKRGFSFICESNQSCIDDGFLQIKNKKIVHFVLMQQLLPK